MKGVVTAIFNEKAFAVLRGLFLLKESVSPLFIREKGNLHTGGGGEKPVTKARARVQ